MKRTSSPESGVLNEAGTCAGADLRATTRTPTHLPCAHTHAAVYVRESNTTRNNLSYASDTMRMVGTTEVSPEIPALVIQGVVVDPRVRHAAVTVTTPRALVGHSFTTTPPK
ncbi:unnamed protein product [Chrysodeixis includens]|uniref:Uncharacterized protein n=1 Tax=Chrysodeixis includens TaxID=689277 RepID=A0A9N8KUS0_CHRIL|nr:unnamed protein product [Chrysodeixis includens]